MGAWLKCGRWKRARSSPGLYPPNEDNKKRYEEWKKTR